jgi:hypothetical protein
MNILSHGVQTGGRPRLLDRVRAAIRVRHYSYRTEDAYVHWIKRYIFFHNVRHPADMGRDEINGFLSHLAVTEQRLPASRTTVFRSRKRRRSLAILSPQRSMIQTTRRTRLGSLLWV